MANNQDTICPQCGKKIQIKEDSSKKGDTGFFPIGPIKSWKSLTVIAIAALSVFMLLIPFLLTRTCLSEWCDRWPTFNNTGQIGDTIGGIANPIIAFVALLFAGAAYWLQYVSHREQKEHDKREKFEDRFYRMLEVHRENSKRIEDEYSFKELYYQYMLLYNEIEEVYDFSFKILANDSNMTEAMLLAPYESGVKKEELICKMAYGHYFYGFDFAISTNKDNPEYKILLEVTASLRNKYNLQQDGTSNPSPLSSSQDPVAEAVAEVISERVKKIEEALKPKNELLGKYYRQLFHIAKYVDECNLFDYDEKYEYMKQLRADMSDFAQIMLYYNSLSTVGSDWNKSKPNINDVMDMGYIPRYKMISNIPFFVEYVGLSPHYTYANDIHYWKTQKQKSFYEMDIATLIK